MEPHLTQKQRFQIYLRSSVDMSLIAGIQLSPHCSRPVSLSSHSLVYHILFLKLRGCMLTKGVVFAW